ncbi:hypothetical protein BJ878DRAFT_483960 [Calycina marina]|uniref:Uncharacterized protein n=1 Tax=Calycina marina TaxID=1763456 RepID=A0A9P8CAX3_9HELO|nr:hypothetical protein BJ878DRAFT_483960 [Calycina marina]
MFQRAQTGDRCADNRIPHQTSFKRPQWEWRGNSSAANSTNPPTRPQKICLQKTSILLCHIKCTKSTERNYLVGARVGYIPQTFGDCLLSSDTRPGNIEASSVAQYQHNLEETQGETTPSAATENSNADTHNFDFSQPKMRMDNEIKEELEAAVKVEVDEDSSSDQFPTSASEDAERQTHPTSPESEVSIKIEFEDAHDDQTRHVSPNEPTMPASQLSSLSSAPSLHSFPGINTFDVPRVAHHASKYNVYRSLQVHEDSASDVVKSDQMVHAINQYHETPNSENEVEMADSHTLTEFQPTNSLAYTAFLKLEHSASVALANTENNEHKDNSTGNEVNGVRTAPENILAIVVKQELNDEILCRIDKPAIEESAQNMDACGFAVSIIGEVGATADLAADPGGGKPTSNKKQSKKLAPTNKSATPVTSKSRLKDRKPKGNNDGFEPKRDSIEIDSEESDDTDSKAESLKPAQHKLQRAERVRVAKECKVALAKATGRGALSGPAKPDTKVTHGSGATKNVEPKAPTKAASFNRRVRKARAEVPEIKELSLSEES